MSNSDSDSSNSQRYETPDGTLLPPLMRHKSIDEKFRKGAHELPSMDFKTTKDSLREQATLIPLADTQKKQELKAIEAAEYRANLLKQKKKERIDGVEMSPAYGREKAYLLRSEQQKADDREREANIDGKATFAQCAFNLANILMVSAHILLHHLLDNVGHSDERRFRMSSIDCYIQQL
jgi:hypothetical protein